MTKKVEGKLHGLTKLQDNDWVVKLVMSTEDYTKWGVGGDPMGTRYNLEISDADGDEYTAVYTDPTDKARPIPTKGVREEKSEGDKLRERACILCGEGSFFRWLCDYAGYSFTGINKERHCKESIYKHCGIKSRTELVTNKEAQAKFRELDRKYQDWLNPVDEIYKANLERG